MAKGYKWAGCGKSTGSYEKGLTTANHAERYGGLLLTGLLRVKNVRETYLFPTAWAP